MAMNPVYVWFKGKIDGKPFDGWIREMPNKMDYSSYLETGHWKETRYKAILRAKHRCERCGKESGLQVHHKTYKNLGNEQEIDLEVLCRDCHEDEHS
jgi:5-methylcytosine-specific restriction endonuclease McrA